MFKNLLIANRGEIACRIIKTAKRLGIESIAVYSTADKDSLHVASADKAFCIGAPESRESYLNIEAILSVAKKAKAEAIHPGYGFLSENPDFAKACRAENIIFIGPSPEAMKAMASKQLAKQLLAHKNVPLTPGYFGENQSDQILLEEAKKIGFPVLLKAAYGGGGKGMRIIESEKEFQLSLESARREAMASFGNDIMIIEKYISNPRHIEIQLMADNYGNIVHCFERDCSIQRRHQKIIEEAPAPNLSDKLRQELANTAITVAHAIDYRGAGTVEFLVGADGSYYFMEMNTRLQVEHPVTEMITGLDLVEWQLRIAANEPIPLTQEQIQHHGHALECRIYAEDPYHQFLPSIGTIDFLNLPQQENVRIDTGIQLHSQITRYYDPMVAKLIVYGETRDEAIQHLHHALQHYAIGGIKTNIPLLKAIIEEPHFQKAQLSTHFLSQQTITLPTPNIRLALYMACAFDYLQLIAKNHSSITKDTFAWQPHLKRHWTTYYLMHQEYYPVTISPIDNHRFIFKHLQDNIILTIQQKDNLMTVDDGQQTIQAFIHSRQSQIDIFSNEGVISVERFSYQPSTLSSTKDNLSLKAPMPATVVAILKDKGEKVSMGEPLMVLEAMKMEHVIHATINGTLTNIFFAMGEQVSEGTELMTLDSEME